MHWIKLFLEGWFFLGITTAIVGIIWTNRESRKLDGGTAKATPAPRLPEFSAKELSEARSA